MKNGIKQFKKILPIILVLIVLLVMPHHAYAEDEVYFTWEEYAEANGLDSRDWHVVADAIDTVIDKAVNLYESGDSKEAYEYAKATYWGYYETTGFERNTMTYISGSRVSAVELQFTTFRKAVKKELGLDTVKEEGKKLSDMLHEDADILNPDGAGKSEDSNGVAASDDGKAEDKKSSGGDVATLIGSLTIILREGLEAILIVGAIVAYLIKTGNRKGVISVYVGAAFAVVCSFIMAWIISYLKSINPENVMSQEIIEGVAALLAVAVLFYVSNWMISKSESAAWSKYIDSKVEGAASRGALIGLGFTAWLAVFREGAEVILFYQPLMQESNERMVWTGFFIGCAALVVIFLLIRLLTIKIPIKPFFMGTSILMALMSICFLGAGIKELIEGGVIDATYHNWFPLTDTLDILGIYPLYETLIPQLILLIIVVITFILHLRRNKKIRDGSGGAKEASA